MEILIWKALLIVLTGFNTIGYRVSTIALANVRPDRRFVRITSSAFSILLFSWTLNVFWLILVS